MELAGIWEITGLSSLRRKFSLTPLRVLALVRIELIIGKVLGLCFHFCLNSRLVQTTYLDLKEISKPSCLGLVSRFIFIGGVSRP